MLPCLFISSPKASKTLFEVTSELFSPISTSYLFNLILIVINKAFYAYHTHINLISLEIILPPNSSFYPAYFRRSSKLSYDFFFYKVSFSAIAFLNYDIWGEFLEISIYSLVIEFVIIVIQAISQTRIQNNCYN